jgi:hypothetical protein
VLLIAKGCIPLSLIESPWVRRLVLMCDSKMAFPSRRQLVKEHIPTMFMKTMEQYVLPLIGKCTTVSVTFELWMSRGTQDTFCMVLNFLDTDWMPQHVTVGVLRAENTSGVALATIVKPLLKEFNLIHKVHPNLYVPFFLSLQPHVLLKFICRLRWFCCNKRFELLIVVRLV